IYYFDILNSRLLKPKKRQVNTGRFNIYAFQTRKLSNFEFITDGKISILGLTNEVTFSLPGNKKVYEPYNETWIFEKTDSTIRPVRCHYSKVTVDKHSEEVN
ncbi:MAG: hypothetical protein J0I84_06215, partial [Terrimonas sp.]|nr:hypothetical protein [Terrimonas sp.]